MKTAAATVQPILIHRRGGMRPSIELGATRWKKAARPAG